MLWRRVVRHYRLGTTDHLRGCKKRKLANGADHATSRKRRCDFLRDGRVRLGPNDCYSSVVAGFLRELDVVRPALSPPRAARSQHYKRLVETAGSPQHPVHGETLFV